MTPRPDFFRHLPPSGKNWACRSIAESSCIEEQKTSRVRTGGMLRRSVIWGGKSAEEFCPPDRRRLPQSLRDTPAGAVLSTHMSARLRLRTTPPFASRLSPPAEAQTPQIADGGRRLATAVRRIPHAHKRRVTSQVLAQALQASEAKPACRRSPWTRTAAGTRDDQTWPRAPDRKRDAACSRLLNRVPCSGSRAGCRSSNQPHPRLKRGDGASSTSPAESLSCFLASSAGSK